MSVHPYDIEYEDHILTELLLDLFEYGLYMNPMLEPIVETWIDHWNTDFRFRNFILNKQGKSKATRSAIIKIIEETEESEEGFHLQLREKRKHIFYKIKRERKIKYAKIRN